MAYQYYKKLPNKTNAYEGYAETKELLKEEIEKINKELTYPSFNTMIEEVNKTKDYTKIVIEILLKLNNKLTKYQDEHQIYTFTDIAKKIIELVKNHENVRQEILRGEYHFDDDVMIYSLPNVKKLLLTHFWPEIDKQNYINEAKEYLTHVYGDLTVFITNMIEAEVNRNKG